MHARKIIHRHYKSVQIACKTANSINICSSNRRTCFTLLNFMKSENLFSVIDTGY